MRTWLRSRSRRHRAGTTLVITAILALSACEAPSDGTLPGEDEVLSYFESDRRIEAMVVGNVASLIVYQDANQLRRGGSLWAKVGPYIFLFSEETKQLFEDDVQEILERTPGMDTRTRGLPVSIFDQAEVDRVGDPLYGQLRRMSALVEADAILIPITATFEPNETIVNGLPRVRITATLVEPRTGRVMWYGIEEGGDFDQSDPRALASAVEALASTVFWYAGD